MRRSLLYRGPLTVLVVAFSLLLALAACGNDSADEPEAVASELTPTETPSEFVPEMVFQALMVEDGTVDSVAYHPDGDTVAAGAFTRIFILDAEDGSEIGGLETDHMVGDLEYSPDGDLLAAGLGVYGVQLLEPDGAGDPIQLHDGYDNYLGFHPEGDQIATANRDGQLWIWDVNSREQLIEIIPTVEESALSVTFSPDGALVALGVWNGDILLFQSVDGSLEGTLENPGDFGYAHSLTFSPDGERLAVAGAQAEFTDVVRIWELDGGAEYAVLEAETQTRAVAWSPDGAQIAYGYADGVTLIDAETLDVTYEIEFELEPGGSGWNTGLAYSPDGTMLFLSRWDGYVEMWRVQQ
jgi:WD40 repeat protein